MLDRFVVALLAMTKETPLPCFVPTCPTSRCHEDAMGHSLHANRARVLPDGPRCVVARGIEEGHYMVSVLSWRVFTIADSDRALCHIDVRPIDSVNLGLTHCSGHREARVGASFKKERLVGAMPSSSDRRTPPINLPQRFCFRFRSNLAPMRFLHYQPPTQEFSRDGAAR
jgi:hypothetical protein